VIEDSGSAARRCDQVEEAQDREKHVYRYNNSPKNTLGNLSASNLWQVENGNEHLFSSYELMFIVIITALRKILLAVLSTFNHSEVESGNIHPFRSYELMFSSSRAVFYE
jgi:hypothetical protein